MQLTQDQTQTMIKWLESHWGAHKCICGHDDWLIADKIFEINEHRDAINAQFATQPVIAVICKYCGNTIYVNAIIAKIVESQGGPNEKQK
jgi:hypothetical protein